MALTYSSEWNGMELDVLMGCGVFPCKRKARGGPSGPSPEMEMRQYDDEKKDYFEPRDVLDEALYYFKTSMLIKAYKVAGHGDRLILFLTHYMHQLLKAIVGLNEKEARAKVIDLQISYNITPTSSSFPFAPFFKVSGKSSHEDEAAFQQYSKQIRYEMGMRFVSAVFKFPEPDGTGSRFWLLFAKHDLLAPRKA